MDVLHYLATKFQEEIATLDNQIAGGKASNYAEYRAACGVRLGLMKATGILQETENMLKEQDEE